MTHDDETVERVADAIRLSRARDWEGEYETLGDLLGFGGENKTVIVCRAAARAALSALPERELLREALEALEPFALKAEKDISDREFNDDIYEAVYRHEAPHLTVGDLRRARAAADKIRAALGGEKP